MRYINISIYRWRDFGLKSSIKIIEPQFKFVWFMWIENMSYFYATILASYKSMLEVGIKE